MDPWRHDLSSGLGGCQRPRRGRKESGICNGLESAGSEDHQWRLGIKSTHLNCTCFLDLFGDLVQGDDPIILLMALPMCWDRALRHAEDIHR